MLGCLENSETMHNQRWIMVMLIESLKREWCSINFFLSIEFNPRNLGIIGDEHLSLYDVLGEIIKYEFSGNYEK